MCSIVYYAESLLWTILKMLKKKAGHCYHWVHCHLIHMCTMQHLFSTTLQIEQEKGGGTLLPWGTVPFQCTKNTPISVCIYIHTVAHTTFCMSL